MSIALETIQQSEHFRLRKAYNRIFVVGALLAIVVHVLMALFSPPYTPRPYQLRERSLAAVDIPDDIVIPPPPQEISRPELPQEAEISEEASEEETLAPTSFDPFAPPAVPDVGSGGEAEVFVAFDTPPEVVHQVAAEYPELARQAEAEGIVQVLITIDETGRVVDAKVQSSDAIESLQQSAVAAARKWLFKPAKQRDKPVKVRIVIPFRFSLN
ncbi:MAG: energy transducer TonB [Candidatus Eisenbacteria bacterium]|uniref:Energy transducer TonB n=1 Tax=Eiseniibacteriota bacterium TaxID=2212470 RepID=A0A956N9D3_UNCEI|nr:energy transducer TonB [Candidatus Eisenbacteria bacterium]MCB9462642.1 energy transducer TonB [Candidatus Eisenbacteria bacterium]